MSYGNEGKGFSVMAFVLIVVICIIGGYRGCNIIQYTQDIGGHLKRAADANSVTLASSELKIALEGIDEWELCPEVKKIINPEDLPRNCYTSVLWKTPDEDVAFWRYNLQEAYKDITALSTDADSLTESNALIKLRETLTDNGEKGTTITSPTGISVYPHNAVLGWILGLLTMGFVVAACVARVREW